MHDFMLFVVSCRYVQVEYGPMELDLNLRVRIHELEKHLAAQVASVPLQAPGTWCSSERYVGKKNRRVC